MTRPLLIFFFLVTYNLCKAQIHAEKNGNNDPEFYFTENKGQVGDQYKKVRHDVLFGGSFSGVSFHLRKNGISYQLAGDLTWKDHVDIKTGEPRKIIDRFSIYRLDLNFLNSNPSAGIIKEISHPGYNNFYSETCPNGVLGVKSFERIVYKNIYTGIDLKWYEKNGELKYDYVVSAGADYKAIKIEILGASAIHTGNGGELILSTPFGKITEQAPVVIQENKILPSRWIVEGNLVTFAIKDADPAYPLFIDPAVRAWGTYYGGAGSDIAEACATDAKGNVYLAGGSGTIGGTVIATIGSHQATFGGGSQMDAMLVKFDAKGNRLWGTYYGGNALEDLFGLCIDTKGNTYITGKLDDNVGNAIATSGSHQPSFGGGYTDAFFAKFDPNGVRQWGTYYGGSGTEIGIGCSADTVGNVYFSGQTTSAIGDTIATTGSHQALFGGGNNDAFLAKFDLSGTRLWSSYYGGQGDDVANTCVVDHRGDVYLAGRTTSTLNNVIATPGAHQPLPGGGTDGFVAKFTASGSRLWGTYYGGNGYDELHACGIDRFDNVNLAGTTGSGNDIAINGSHQPLIGGRNDGFLVQLNLSGIRNWATYYGDTADNYILSYSGDPGDNIYISGFTRESNGAVLTTPGSHQTVYGGSSWDAVLAKFNSGGIRQWGTYYGGSGVDMGRACAADGLDSVYLCGGTSSTGMNVISTANCHQQVHGGGFYDGFLVKFSDAQISAIHENIKTNNLQNIYPNPAVNFVTIDLAGETDISFYDSMGRLLFEARLRSPHADLVLTPYPPGLYFIRSGPHVYKLIKE